MPNAISINIQNLCQICSGPNGSCTLTTGNINQHLNSAGRWELATVNYCYELSGTQKAEKSMLFFQGFQTVCARRWKENALLKGSSRTTLQNRECCRSMTPPDRRHKQEFVHELMQQHTSSANDTTLVIPCHPPKNTRHTDLKTQQCIYVVSGWQFWMGIRTEQGQIWLSLPQALIIHSSRHIFRLKTPTKTPI